MDKISLEQEVAAIFEEIGEAGINLIVDRHKLATKKRMLFTIRYVEKDKDKEAELTAEMNHISARIDAIDVLLYNKFGVTKKERPAYTKAIKSAYPNEWQGGFRTDWDHPTREERLEMAREEEEKNWY